MRHGTGGRGRRARWLQLVLAGAVLAGLLALTPPAMAQELPGLPSVKTVSCTAQPDGGPTFTASVDVYYDIYEGDTEYRIVWISGAWGESSDPAYSVENFTGGGRVDDDGPPYVLVWGNADLVRGHWEYALGFWRVWVEDARFSVGCDGSDHVGA